MFFLLDPYSEGGGHEEEWTDPTTGCTAGVSNRVFVFMILEHFLRIDDCLLEREKVHLTKWGQQAGQLGEKSFKIEVAR